jgi:hypothetical protein
MQLVSTVNYGSDPSDAENAAWIGEEAQIAASALVGLGAFPADAPANFDYQRISDNTLRTYRMGNCMVRIRPTTLQAPQPGWTMIDSAGILWRR